MSSLRHGVSLGALIALGQEDALVVDRRPLVCRVSIEAMARSGLVIKRGSRASRRQRSSEALSMSRTPRRRGT